MYFFYSLNCFLLFFFSKLLLAVLIIVPLLVAVAYFTVAERKVMASIQRRRGPNVVGFWGLLQPLADGLKLVTKEMILPNKANNTIFIISSVWTLFLSLIVWTVIPFNYYNVFSNVDLSLLYVLSISGLGIYGIILAGWSSNSKYAFLGALRTTAQMISYEISIGLTILPVVLCTGSFNLIEIVRSQQAGTWFIFPLLPLALISFISILAETNRAPFDLPEAEAEIVAGYNVEYSGILFAMFFLGEYSNMLVMSSLCVILFFGGWLSPFQIFQNYQNIQILALPHECWFALKITFFAFLFILVRACLPRFRYDQLMNIGWKKFLPITLGYFFFISGLLVAFNGLPYSFK